MLRDGSQRFVAQHGLLDRWDAAAQPSEWLIERALLTNSCQLTVEHGQDAVDHRARWHSAQSLAFAQIDQLLADAGRVCRHACKNLFGLRYRSRGAGFEQFGKRCLEVSGSASAERHASVADHKLKAQICLSHFDEHIERDLVLGI